MRGEAMIAIPPNADNVSDECWPCGHPRTLDNTQRIGRAGVRCRTCRRSIGRKSYHTRLPDLPPEERRRMHRIEYIPGQVERTRAKLAALIAEADSLGVRL